MLNNPLYIAEKPDMGAKIARGLPQPHKRGNGYIETGAGIVSWAFGHILQQAPPETYDEKYKKWNQQDLPIIPNYWKSVVSKSKSKQLSILKKLIQNCSEIVNAGDPGREGQLIVDEILEFLHNKKPVYRLTLNSLDVKTVKKALANIEPNQKYIHLYEAALGRQRADWLVGMNLTRAYTIEGQSQGYQGVLSVGRVQTPTLSIVVKREEEIKNFIPKKYWNLAITLDSSPNFKAKYKIPEKVKQEFKTNGNLPQWLDESFRIINDKVADKIIHDVPNGTQAIVKDFTKEPKKEYQPLPFILSDLQSRMNSKMGAGVKDTLAACQSLYEGGYATYPRTDCNQLPPSQFNESQGLLDAIKQSIPELSNIIGKTNISIKSKAWDDNYHDEHHAIIPTATAPDISSLSPLEKAIYIEISKRYIAQFLPPCEVNKVYVVIESGGHEWDANGRTITKLGWREVYTGENKNNQENEEDEDENQKETKIPDVKKGDTFHVSDNEKSEQTTQPPNRYTEGTLIKAMEHIHRLVDDPKEKKMLKNTKGIGRSSTRDSIIETLLKRKFLEKNKKYLIPSDMGTLLVKSINKDLTDPGLTARWEQVLDGVALGKIPLQAFQQKQEQWVTQLIKKVSLPNLGKNIPNLENKKPKAQPLTNQPCPKCGKPLIKRTVKGGKYKGKQFLGCTGFPNCKYVEWPKK